MFIGSLLHYLMLIESFLFQEDTCLFSCFYDFVFFICREKGQKSISKILHSQGYMWTLLVYFLYPQKTNPECPLFFSIAIQRAVAAWKIVLNGRFRLLDRWCNFVEVQNFVCTAMVQIFHNSPQTCVVLIFVFFNDCLSCISVICHIVPTVPTSSLLRLSYMHEDNTSLWSSELYQPTSDQVLTSF